MWGVRMQAIGLWGFFQLACLGLSFAISGGQTVSLLRTRGTVRAWSGGLAYPAPGAKGRYRLIHAGFAFNTGKGVGSRV